MAAFDNNPFGIPGMGQSDAATAHPVMAAMEMMRQAWSAVAGLSGAAHAMPPTPPMAPEELDKRIAELKSIEGWLSMNLSMLTRTIQGMEVQRATIATLRSLSETMGMPGLGGSPAPASSASSTFDGSNSAQAASAWWDMLQGQFNQMAAAAAAMPQKDAAQAGAEQADAPKARAPSSHPKKAPAKRASATRRSKAAEPTAGSTRTPTPSTARKSASAAGRSAGAKKTRPSS